MNERLELLQPYPFQKLAAIKKGIQANSQYHHINLSIGEPKHEVPEFLLHEWKKHIHLVSHYPTTKGSEELRHSITQWLNTRFHLKEGLLDHDRHVLPINGSREALFSIAQTVVRPPSPGPRPAVVMMPNPFYQIYEGAALLAGAQPYFINPEQWQDLDQVPQNVWENSQLLYLCNPDNPSGHVLSLQNLQQIIERSQKYNFIVASDECYSEIYANQPPPGLLQAAAGLGLDSFDRCMVFHSLSKRSNVPGLRSGFVAGDAKLIEKYLLYRTYHGCAMSPVTQMVSTKAWQDEQHVRENRQLYQQKFDAVVPILKKVLPVEKPPAGFYLWLAVGEDDLAFAKNLFREYNVSLLPGSFLSRDTPFGNPGHNHLRMALVASSDDCVDAATRIASYIEFGVNHE